MMADIVDDIATAALKPKSATSEAGSVSSHSLPDQIAAAKFILGQAAGSKNRLGIRFRKFTPPGMVPGVPSTVDDDVGF